MMSRFSLSSLVLVFGLFLECHASPTREHLMLRVLNGVEKEAEFFSRDYSDLNLDGLFGLRVGEGQLREAVELCQNKDCGEILTERLYSLLRLVTKTGEVAMPYIKEQDPVYFEKFSSIVDKPYTIKYNAHTFKNIADIDIGSDTKYKEAFGDRCFSRVIGTYVDGDRKIAKCNVTDECWNFMTKKNTAKYFITHQLMYFILSEQVGCENGFNKYEISETPKAVINRMCRQIYKESINLVHDHQVKESNQDLFLEQSLLCGALGFENFLRPDWMRMVLNWQRNEGCFGNQNSLNLPELLDNLSGNRRKLLRETAMEDDCLSHKSGLGFGVLSLYLRYFIEKL